MKKKTQNIKEKRKRKRKEKCNSELLQLLLSLKPHLLYLKFWQVKLTNPNISYV